MAIVYQHRRLDNNEIFYVGIGHKKTRAYLGSTVNKTQRKCRWRNNFWNNVVLKTEYIVEIVFENISYEFALEKEKELIRMYGRADLGTGTLTNLTDGGEGTSGFNSEILQRISRKGFNHSEETKKKLSISSRLQNLGKKHSNETKNTISLKAKGNTRRLGTTHSEESKLKMSQQRKGKPSHNKGKVTSESTKKKLSVIRIESGVSKGSNNPNSKLNEIIVDEIRKLYSTSKISQRKLALKYNVCASTIEKIVNNKIWN